MLSSRALTMQNQSKDRTLFIAPDIWQNTEPQDFIPTDELKKWEDFVNRNYTEISVRTGRWNVPGKPPVVLVDFSKLFEKKDIIYGDFWEKFKVNSLDAYGDYDEASMFGYASGIVIEIFVKFHEIEKKKIVAHFNEWMTAFGLFYVKAFCPQIATVFTTHATTIGRSIAGNGKPLYDNLPFYNGDQMAKELNVTAKHSAEKQAAHFADCFTAVSDITATECKILLEKAPDIVTPNGFENDFVSQKDNFLLKRTKARVALRSITQKNCGSLLKDNVIFIGLSGRYEFKNKGIDVFIDVIAELKKLNLKQHIVAFIMVPAWVNKNEKNSCEFTSATLMEGDNDRVISSIKWHGFTNRKNEYPKILFVPVYLNGEDGKINLPYYDLLVGFDLTVFPSYYEPWGYTPLESAVFSVPTITTSLSGFGQWVSGKSQGIEKGVAVVERNDHNYLYVVENIKNQVIKFISKSEKERKKIADKAQKISQNALWSNFFEFYKQAYQIAMLKLNE